MIDKVSLRPGINENLASAIYKRINMINKMKKERKMKKLLAFILICACILPRVMNINITINHNIKVHKQNE